MGDHLITLEERLGPCPKVLKFGKHRLPFSFYFCLKRDEFPNCKKSGEICAFDVAQNEEFEAVQALANACKEKGYAVRPNKWREAWLNDVCWLVNIEGLDKRRTFSARHTSRRCRILPLAELKNHKAQRPYHQRSSALHGCHISRILANTLKDRLPIKIIDTIDSKLGTVEHKLQNFDGDNAEVELEYSICCEGKTYTTRGHADRLIKFVNAWQETEGIGTYDFKHAEYSSSESIKFILQTLSYAVGAAQLLNLAPKYFRLVTVRSPFGDFPYAKRETQPLMTQIPNKPENDIVKMLHKEMAEGVEVQRELLSDFRAAEKYRIKWMQKKCDGCLTKYSRKTGAYDAPCFSEQVCGFLFSEAKGQNVALRNLLKQNNWVPKDYALISG